jgi:hypothetical protein
MRGVLISVCVSGVGLNLASCSAHDQHTTQDDGQLQDVSEPPIEALRIAYKHNGLTVYSGGEPSADGAFEHLLSLGVTTVVSVDATSPEADTIESMGMRSVHVPMSYSGVPIECQSAVAKAIRESEGAVYIHCHHGLHRGPTATAAGLIALGYMTQGEAVEYMRQAGTSMSYKKLYRGVANATELDNDTIEHVELVRIAKVKELAAQMAEIDRVFENLELLAANNWHAPDDHPDLSAVSEAGQMSDLFRSLDPDIKVVPCPPIEIIEIQIAHWDRYLDATKAAQELENAIVAGDSVKAKIKLESLGNRCNDCHSRHR